MTAGSFLTEALNRWADGDGEAPEQAMQLASFELRKIARRALGRDKAGRLLQPTDLIQETYLKVDRLPAARWPNRRAFYAFASRVMRLHLVDLARAAGRAKRGGDIRHVELDTSHVGVQQNATDLLALSDAISSLEKEDRTAGQIVDLRFFGGLHEEEVAAVLGVSRSTVQRRWKVARRYLAIQLGEHRQ